MMSWKDYLNYLMSLIKLTVSIFILFSIFIVETNAQQDSIKEYNPQDTVLIMQKSPWGAVLRSAIIPGWGQIYNEGYFKAVLFWGVGAWLAYNWIISNDNYKQYQEFYNLTGYSLYKDKRDLSRDNRDMFTIYFILTYILNLVDAYVDAHLFDFTVEEDFYTRQPMMNIKIKLF
jgi:hypothetical protein